MINRRAGSCSFISSFSIAMAVLPDPAHDWALFLDVDGTLIPIAEHPDSVQPGPRLGAILSHCADALNGALALISGRPIAEIDALTDHVVPAAAGLHGLELRTTDGHYAAAGGQDMPALARGREKLRSLTRAYPELHLEDKHATLALHYRGASSRAIEAARQTTDAIVAAADGSLTRLAGKSVYEIKPVHGNKGDALHSLLSTGPFLGRTPVYIGDDVTDEAGFAAANALGGVSIRVGALHDSHARYHLNTVDEVLEWLEAIAQALTCKVEQPT